MAGGAGVMTRELVRLAAKQLVKMAAAQAGKSAKSAAGRALTNPPPAVRVAAPRAPLRPVSPVRKYAEFVKLSHTVFALPFALASMVVASRATHGWPGWRIFGLILAAMVTARTCAMAFNR